MRTLYESGWIRKDISKVNFGNLKCFPMISTWTGYFKIYTFEKVDKIKIQIQNKYEIIYFYDANKLKWLDQFEIVNTAAKYYNWLNDDIIPCWTDGTRFMFSMTYKDKIKKLFDALFIKGN